MTINTVLLSCFSVFSTQLETMAPRPDVLLQNVLQNVANGKQNVLDKTHKGQAVFECIWWISIQSNYVIQKVKKFWIH